MGGKESAKREQCTIPALYTLIGIPSTTPGLCSLELHEIERQCKYHQGNVNCKDLWRVNVKSGELM